MSGLVVASPSEGFDTRITDAFGDELNGHRRYWRDGLLDGSAAAAVDELTRSAPDVVAIGPDLPIADAIELAEAFDAERPDIVVVLVADPSIQVYERALRSGARDVVAPDAPSAELRLAFEQALDAAGRRRSALAQTEGSAPSSPRHLCGVAQGRYRKDDGGHEPRHRPCARGAGRSCDRRPRPPVRRRRERAETHTRAHVPRHLAHTAEYRRDDGEDLPHVARQRPLRALRAGCTRRRGLDHRRAGTPHRVLARISVSLRRDRHGIGPRRAHPRSARALHRPHRAHVYRRAERARRRARRSRRSISSVSPHRRVTSWSTVPMHASACRCRTSRQRSGCGRISPFRARGWCRSP